MSKILALWDMFDATQQSIIILVAIVVLGAAIAIYLFTRPDKTTDY